MQISYHSAITKIQKLQNLKKKKKKKNFPVPASITWNWPVRPIFFPVRNKGVICTGLLAGTVYTGWYGTESTRDGNLDPTRGYPALPDLNGPDFTRPDKE